jgi:hypothetical protein
MRRVRLPPTEARSAEQDKILEDHFAISHRTHMAKYVYVVHTAFTIFDQRQFADVKETLPGPNKSRERTNKTLYSRMRLLIPMRKAQGRFSNPKLPGTKEQPIPEKVSVPTKQPMACLALDY